VGGSSGGPGGGWGYGNAEKGQEALRSGLVWGKGNRSERRTAQLGCVLGKKVSMGESRLKTGGRSKTQDMKEKGQRQKAPAEPGEATGVVKPISAEYNKSSPLNQGRWEQTTNWANLRRRPEIEKPNYLVAGGKTIRGKGGEIKVHQNKREGLPKA